MKILSDSTESPKSTRRNSEQSKIETRRFNSAIVERLEDLLKSKGMTSKQLGEELGINANTFGKYFSLSSKIPCDVVCSMAKLLGVSVDYLFGLTESKLNRRVSIDESTSIDLSDSALDSLSRISSENILVLSELLEDGILEDILTAFRNYKSEVSSALYASSSSLWFQNCLAMIQSHIEELKEERLNPDNPQDHDKFMNIIESMPAGRKQDLAQASYFLFIDSGLPSGPGFRKTILRKAKFESAFEISELLGMYEESTLGRISDKQLCNKIESSLLERLNSNLELARSIKDLVGSPPVKEYRKKFQDAR